MDAHYHKVMKEREAIKDKGNRMYFAYSGVLDSEAFKDWSEAVGRYGDHLKASDSEDINVVYPTAGHEVRRWIGLVGVEGLRRLVDQVATGRDFFTVYVALEQEVRR